MEMTGEQIIDQPQSKVWEALNDTEVLKGCIPGCDTLEKVSDTEYKMTMTAAVGPVRAKFNGKLMLSDVNAPVSYTIAFEGSGGAAGFGKGSAQVALSPEGSGTKLSYNAKAQIGGKLAQVGARLIDGVAKKMADDFFTAFKTKLTPAAPAAPEPGAAVAGTASTGSGAPSTSDTPKLKPLITIAVILAIIIVLYFMMK